MDALQIALNEIELLKAEVALKNIEIEHLKKVISVHEKSAQNVEKLLNEFLANKITA